MSIYVDELWSKYLIGKNISDLKNYECTFVNSNDIDFLNNPDNYYISWGENKNKIRHSVIETGFFRNSVHMDTIGLYEKASFNFYVSKKIIEDYNAPVSLEKINAICPPLTKFPQTKGIQNWEHIVAICQNPKDRSIWRVGSSGDYYNFLDKIASYYKNKLLLKKHPVVLNDKEDCDILENIALKHGCELQNTDISIIDNCESVFVYNSTFVIDAIYRNKHVYQYSPGYFWQSGIVQYTNKNIPTKQYKTDTQYNMKFIEFLLWKYCFPESQKTEKLLKIIHEFKNSGDIFPLPEDCSYAQYMLDDTQINKLPVANHLGGHCNVTHIDKGTLSYLKDTFNIKNVLDIGCGPGLMKDICKELNIEWTGIDGDPNCIKENTIHHDYTISPYNHENNFYDLAWSIEFLEHVDERYINNYIKYFQKCKIICITHALPGKNGHHHVNCQLPNYWIDIFEKNGFTYSEKHTEEIRKKTTMNREFIKNTGMVFIKKQ